MSEKTSKQSPVRKDAIAGIEGREPVGVVLSAGVKDSARGFPTEKEYFHLVVPREENGKRAHHPAFSGFNQAKPERRKTVRGVIVHATETECFEGYLRCQVGYKNKGQAHPDRRPFCEGDGVHAMRWLGEAPDDFAEIKCPADKCEYRLTEPKLCKPFSRLLFLLNWSAESPLPKMLCKFTSGSVYTYMNLRGFFDRIKKTAHQLGLEDYSLLGLPFSLTLTMQTRPSKQTKFPVIVITPEIDPLEFFYQQRERIGQLQAQRFTAIEDQREHAIELEDVRALHIGGNSE